MAARDFFHDVVKNALLKDGWTITDDPLFIRIGESDLYIDLAAEKIIAAEKEEQKIAIEIKSFIGTSFMTDFHHAVGQFINYRVALAEEMPERILYLAVPVDVYNTFFGRKLIRIVVQNYQINLIVYEDEKEEIVKWIN